MERQVLAGFAGFCAACAILFCLKWHDPKPEIHARAPEYLQAPAEPINRPESNVTQAEVIGARNIHLATYQQTSPPNWTINSIKARTFDGQELLDTSKLKFNSPGPLTLVIELNPIANVTPEPDMVVVTLPGSTSPTTATRKTGNTFEIQADKYGEYKFKTKTDPTEKTCTVIPEPNAGKEDNDRLDVTPKLTVNGDVVAASGPLEDAVYATNGPASTYEVIVRFPEKATLINGQTFLKDGFGNPVPTTPSAIPSPTVTAGASQRTYTYALSRLGTYTFTAKGNTTDGVGFSKTLKFEIQQSSSESIPDIETVLISQAIGGKEYVMPSDKPLVALRTTDLIFAVKGKPGRNLSAVLLDDANNRVKRILGSKANIAAEDTVPILAGELSRLPAQSSVKIAVIDDWLHLNSPVAAKPLVVTRTSEQNVAPPSILKYSSNSAQQNTEPIASNAATIFGNGITLEGYSQPGSQVTLLMYSPFEAKVNAFFESGRANATSQTDGTWKATILLPGNNDGARHVIAMAERSGAFALSTPLAITLKPNTLPSTNVSVARIVPLTGQEAGAPPIQDGMTTSPDVRIFLTVSDAQNGDLLEVRLKDEVVGQKRLQGTPVTAAETFVDARGLKEGLNQMSILLYRGDQTSKAISSSVTVQSKGPAVKSVTPIPSGIASPLESITIHFDGKTSLNVEAAEEESNYVLVGKTNVKPQLATYSEESASVRLVFFTKSGTQTTFNAPLDDYVLHINGRRSPSDIFSTTSVPTAKIGIRDRLGNFLAGDGKKNETDYETSLSDGTKPNDGAPGSGGIGISAGFAVRKPMELPELTAEVPNLAAKRDVGLPAFTGDPVDFPEFTPPRDEQNGFNPSDKVVSRVARLYYFRDAHRVAQIINRRSKSHNAQNASIARQMADKARLYAEQTVDRRRSAERQAVEASSYARHAENAIAKYRAQLDAANAAVRSGQERIATVTTTLTTLEAAAAQPGQTVSDKTKTQIEDARKELAQLQTAVKEAQNQADAYSELASSSLAALDALREQELQQREVMDREQAGEDRAADHQFRLEVQAADTDPDTYAAGNPSSQDPVSQVSLSVIGEGLIQMRGPLKGVNIIHTMINEIDSPVGQVRVGIHTVQINGEKGEDMEEIALRIQRYTDHSRFLTSQSAQMLRNAVSLVASRKAQECGIVCNPGTVCEDGTIVPANADGTLLVGMNGMPGSASMQRYQDAFFGAEFMAELRAMDSEFVNTSGNKLLGLHSMDSTSLASALFLMSLASNQTRQEILEAFQQSTMCKLPVDEFEYFEASDAKKWYHFNKFKFLADNARFVSLRGHFDAEIVGDTTINPAQREFIKLAQILKSRLITEIELKQRVVERALIEERVGDYKKQLKMAFLREQEAQEGLENSRKELQKQVVAMLSLADRINAATDIQKKKIEHSINEALGSLAANIARFSVDFTKDLGHPNLRSFADFDALITENTREAKSAALQESSLFLTRIATEGDRDAFLNAVLNTKRTVVSILLSDDSLRDNQPAVEYLQDLFGDGKAYIEINFVNGQKLPLSIQDRNGSFAVKFTGLDGVKKFEDIETLPDGTRERVLGLWADRKKYREWAAFSAQDVRRKIPACELSGDAVGRIETTLSRIESNNDIDEIERLLMIFAALKQIREESLLVLESSRERLQATLKAVDLTLRNAAEAAIKGDNARASVLLTEAHKAWLMEKRTLTEHAQQSDECRKNNHESFRIAIILPAIQAESDALDKGFSALQTANLQFQFATAAAETARRPLDHKKFLDMLIDEAEEKHIQLLEGTRAHTAVIDDYVKRICTALEDDFNTQFYDPAFRYIREETYRCGTVSLGQIEHTSVLTNNREFAKVSPQATMEFDLPKRRIMIAEAMAAAQAGVNDYGALLSDPNFLALTKLYSGQPTAHSHSGDSPNSPVRDVLPGLPSQSGESAVIQARTGEPEFQSQLEALVPDPAIYKFETGTGYEIRPVIQPDGQSVVFDFNYMYTTNVREPVDADEKHLGRVKRHFIDTDVQIGNYELREVSRYRVALKAERSGRGVPLLEDVPVAGALFRPMNDGESSLQQNVILANSVIYPTLFDLMGLRWAPAVADLSEEDIKLQEFTYRNRMRNLKNEVYDYSSAQVDEFLRIPQGERRPDLYRTQVPIPVQHPNGYYGPGNGQQDSNLQEGYVPQGQPGDAGVHGGGTEMAPLLPIMTLPPAEHQLEEGPIEHGTQGLVVPETPAPLGVTPAGFRSEQSYSSPPVEDRSGRARLGSTGSGQMQQNSQSQNVRPEQAQRPLRTQPLTGKSGQISHSGRENEATSGNGRKGTNQPAAGSAGTSASQERPPQPPTGKTGIGWRWRNLGGRKSSNSP